MSVLYSAQAEIGLKDNITSPWKTMSNGLRSSTQNLHNGISNSFASMRGRDK